MTLYRVPRRGQEVQNDILEIMNNPSSTKPPAQQERSRRTEQIILQAALKTLTDLGEDAITMNSVSERAGVSVGSIYRRFGSREELLIAMTDEFASGFSHTLHSKLGAAPAEAHTDPTEIIRYATTVLAKIFERNQKAYGRLVLMGVTDPQIFAAGQRASREGGRDYTEFVLQARDAIKRPDVEAAVDYTYRLIYAMCTHRATQGPNLESSRAFSWKNLINELVEMNIAYLLNAPR